MHRQSKVWVVDDDSSIRWVLERALNQAGIDNESFGGAALRGLIVPKDLS